VADRATGPAKDARRVIMMKIEILGTGCPRCDTLAANAKVAAQRLGIKFQVEKTSNVRKYGFVATPALAIDGKVKLSGKVATPAEITTVLTTVLAQQSSD